VTSKDGHKSKAKDEDRKLMKEEIDSLLNR
jgi:hypothetical protein